MSALNPRGRSAPFWNDHTNKRVGQLESRHIRGYVEVDQRRFIIKVGHLVVGVKYTRRGAVELVLSDDKRLSMEPVTIKDEGENATTFNITVKTPDGALIEFEETKVINADGDHLNLYTNKKDWFSR